MRFRFRPFLAMLAAFTTIAFFFGLFFIITPAFSWGVLAPAQTHQHILNEAYRLLSADPAFDPKLFPKLEEILANEGIKWMDVNYTGSGAGIIPDTSFLEGPGPDCKGNSPFSWHYYNPVLKEGNGPMAVGKFFRYLSQGMLTNSRAEIPKAAAWSAHFLADMHCPVHTVGMFKESAVKFKQEQLAKYKGTKFEGAVYLTDDIKGSVKLGYLSPVKSLSNDFQTELGRFLEKGEDWFDPWYYNGTGRYATETSSHIAWETTINPGPYNLSGYEPTWKNAHPGFDHPVDSQVSQASRLAIDQATLTRSKLEYFFDNPEPILNHAIRAVYTMWRASFSGLVPKIAVQEKDSEIHVVAQVHNNAGVSMENTQAKLTVTGGSLEGQNPLKAMGTIESKGTVTSLEWKVKPGTGPCKIKLQVIATCSAPDLQYAETQMTIAPKAAKQPTSGYFNLVKIEMPVSSPEEMCRYFMSGKKPPCGIQFSKQDTDVKFKISEKGSVLDPHGYNVGTDHQSWMDIQVPVELHWIVPKSITPGVPAHIHMDMSGGASSGKNFGINTNGHIKLILDQKVSPYDNSAGDALSGVNNLPGEGLNNSYLSDDFDLNEPAGLIAMLNQGKDYYYRRGKDYMPDFPDLHVKMRDTGTVHGHVSKLNKLPLLDYRLSALSWFGAEPKLVVYYKGAAIAVYTYQWVSTGAGK